MAARLAPEALKAIHLRLHWVRVTDAGVIVSSDVACAGGWMASTNRVAG
jgi:hypothetical protein